MASQTPHNKELVGIIKAHGILELKTTVMDYTRHLSCRVLESAIVGNYPRCVQGELKLKTVITQELRGALISCCFVWLWNQREWMCPPHFLCTLVLTDGQGACLDQ